jgi:hypothetical protein
VRISRWNYADMGAYLREDPELGAALLAIAERGAAITREIAPVGKPPRDEHPGEYKDHIEVETWAGAKDGRQGTRWIAKAPYSAAVEWGSANGPAQHVVLHAMDRLAEEA